VGQIGNQIGNVFSLIFTFPIYNALMLLYHLFGDYGLSIVVLTLVIKLILFPLNIQQLKSTKATQALQPKMAEIRKKYENDKQAQALAMQTLYKEYGVNPLAGCLPLLIQLPVLYGLYYALGNVLHTGNLSSVNGPLYPFVQPFHTFPNLDFKWFTWLSFLNPILHVNWPWSFSLAHPDPSHVLPIIAGLATFIQLRMSQPKPAPDAPVSSKPAQPDPTQSTMKTMQYIMPLFTVFIGWNLASGLALYWTVSAIFQATQQYFVTGWGALLTAPNFKVDSAQSSPAQVSSSNSNGAAKSSGSQAAKRDRVGSTVQPVAALADGDDAKVVNGRVGGAVEQNMRTTPRSNGSGPSQYTRRSRGSASARRRSSNQKPRR